MVEVPLIGQVREKQFSVVQHPAPLAWPVAQLVPVKDGAALMIYGGLSRLEYFLGQILANPAMAGAQVSELIHRAESVCNALAEFGNETEDQD